MGYGTQAGDSGMLDESGDDSIKGTVSERWDTDRFDFSRST